MKNLFNNYKPQNKRSGHKSQPKDSQSLFGSMLSRHGIARQVQSSLVVTLANEILREILPMHAKPDIRAAWFQRGELLIGCRHPAAIASAEEAGERLRIAILRTYPDLTLEKITIRFYPQVFEEKY